MHTFACSLLVCTQPISLHAEHASESIAVVSAVCACIHHDCPSASWQQQQGMAALRTLSVPSQQALCRLSYVNICMQCVNGEAKSGVTMAT